MSRPSRPLSEIRWVVIHHTASNDKYSTHNTLDEHLRATNLGYHVTVDDDLALTVAGAGKDSHYTFKQHVPDDEVVWGAAGCNYHGWHIAIDGNSLLKAPTEDEIHAVVQVIATKLKRWGWGKKDVGDIISHNHVGLHVSNPKYVTECPGLPIIDRLPEIRRRVAAYLPV